MIVFALTIALTGRMYDRYGPKWVIVVCTTFVCMGLIPTSLMTALWQFLWQFLLFYGIIVAIGFGGSSISLVAAMTSTWFIERRGFAVSLAVAGFSLGQFVLVPVFAAFALRYGWRPSYAVMGIVIFVVNLCLAVFVIKGGSPSAFGTTPLGSMADKDAGTGPGQAPPDVPVRDMRLGEALRTRSYWLFMIVMFICGSHDFLVTTHIVPFATDHAVCTATASNMLAWFGLMGLASILIAGPIADKMGVKIPVALTFLLRVLIFLMILKYTSELSIYTFSLAMGFTALVTASLTPIIMSKLYGMSHIGLLSGVTTTVHHFGGGFWAFAGGMIFDYTGGYKAVFILSAVTSALAILCMVLVKEKRHTPE